MATNRQLKELVDTMCSAIDQIASMTSLPDGTGKAARMEMGMFMMYLSASDGTIEWDEARTISDICELNLTPNELGKYIRENNIYSTEFEQKVPVTFQIMVKADEAMRANGIDVSGSDAMISAYKAVGEALIKSDGDVDDNEVSDYKIYINMLEEYRDNNLNGGSGASGFIKNSGSVSAPPKSGVSAPRKG